MTFQGTINQKTKSWAEVRRMILYRCNAEFIVVSNKTKKLKDDARKKKMQNPVQLVGGTTVLNPYIGFTPGNSISR